MFGISYWQLTSWGAAGGRGYGIRTNIFIDETLEPYVDLNINSRAGSPTWRSVGGKISWIGSPQDSVTSIEDIYLVMYTRLDIYELYLEVHPSEVPLPEDTIDYDEATIPLLSVNSTIYNFNLHCLTSIE